MAKVVVVKVVVESELRTARVLACCLCEIDVVQLDVPEEDCEPISPPAVRVVSSVTVVLPVERPKKTVVVPLGPGLNRVTVVGGRLSAKVETWVTVERTETVVVLQAEAASAPTQV